MGNVQGVSVWDLFLQLKYTYCWFIFILKYFCSCFVPSALSKNEKFNTTALALFHAGNLFLSSVICSS